MVLANLVIPDEWLAEYCQRWKITELALFGSVLRDDFGADSDVDALVTFAPDARWTFVDVANMQEEFGRIVSRRVELVTRCGLERSPNYLRRQEIFSSARVIHVAR